MTTTFHPLDADTNRVTIVLDEDPVFATLLLMFMEQEDMIVAPFLGLEDDSVATYVIAQDSSSAVIIAKGQPETLNGPAGTGGFLVDPHGAVWSVLTEDLSTDADLLAERVATMMHALPGWTLRS